MVRLMTYTADHAKQEIKKLLAKYNRVVEEKRIIKYNEEMTKAEFIEPLFEALGWDIRNQNYSDEVTREEKISKNRVDYGFRINGIPKFFLEAKSLKANLDDSKFVEQAINYAWNKGCTWAVLTDFEAVKIFNAEWRTDNYSQSHLKTLPCYEFLDRFDELWLLSKESFAQDALDKEAEKWGKKTKKSSVDKQLLEDFTRFREILSKNIIKLNERRNLTQEDLDESIQRILDRLIFIRNCEDRELEEKQLIANLREWENRGRGQLIKFLREVFSYFDKYYNSKIFAKHLCDELEIDNEVLLEIIEGLYYTKDRSIYYDFSAIEADVLGNIYEQYLGHILRKTQKRATLTESRAHRKEQGIYYTPTYIVDYIVRNTLGRLLEEKKVSMNRIKVVDPACGSGSFLIKTFDVLNDYYTKHDKDYNQTQLDPTVLTGTYTKKLGILQSNIFGVDLDRQAIEVAQLNLLLKVAEKGQRLPLLQQNIKLGNSLIDDPAVAADKAFKWEEQFKEIMDCGGFDVVIGNPPYINIEILPQKEKGALTKYECYAGKSDILYYFYNKGIQLLKPDGILGFITSRYFIEATHAKKLRHYILQNCNILQIIDLSNLPVFKDVGIHTVILIVQKRRKRTIQKSNYIFYKDVDDIKDLTTNNGMRLNQSSLSSDGWVLGSTIGIELFKKINTSNAVRLGDISIIEQGQKSGLNEAFAVNDEIISKNHLEKAFIRKLTKNSYIKPYFIEERGLYLIYASDELNPENAPNIISYLTKFKEKLKKRAEARDGLYPWYRLQRPRSKELFDAKEKIIVPYRAENNRFGYDDQQRYNDGGDVRIIVIKNPEYDVKYVLAILNSKLMNFYYSFIGRKKGTTFEYFVEPLKKIPIAKVSRGNQKSLATLAETMISLYNRLYEIRDKIIDERTRIMDELKNTENKIDELVYKIYGITNDEKKIIEASLK